MEEAEQNRQFGEKTIVFIDEITVLIKHNKMPFYHL